MCPPQVLDTVDMLVVLAAFALAVFCLVQAQRPPLPWPYPLTSESFISFSAPPPSPSLPPEILTWETVTERDRS